MTKRAHFERNMPHFGQYSYKLCRIPAFLEAIVALKMSANPTKTAYFTTFCPYFSIISTKLHQFRVFYSDLCPKWALFLLISTFQGNIR